MTLWKIGSAPSIHIKHQCMILADMQHCPSAFDAIPLRRVDIELSLAHAAPSAGVALVEVSE